jgi:hypothetical protein
LPYISGAVEGPSDETVLRRIVMSRGGEVHRVQVQNGKTNLRRVRQIEAWLLADADRFASFFAVKRTAIPDAPDQLADAKAALVTAPRPLGEAPSGTT